MKRSLKGILKCAGFIVILVLVLTLVNRTLEPKYYFSSGERWPSTYTFRQFYQMEKNSVDVLFLGSSVAVNNFIPQRLYDDYGIRSYNLSSEAQSPFVSYYWLKEALRYQTPKLVVLEPLFMKKTKSNTSFNMREPLVRKAIDPMRWSPVKWEAVRDICQRDASQTFMSYLFTNIRYHNRWKMLQANDFITETNSTPRLFGWAPGRSKLKQVKAFKTNDKDTSYQFPEDMVDYLGRIATLCKDRGISLILVKVPQTCSPEEAAKMDYTYRKLTEHYGIDYYNFQEEGLYDRLHVDPSTDRVDGHGNLFGNLKNTDLTGRIIKEKYNIPSVTDPQYEKARGDYEHMYTRFSLKRVKDIDEYLRAVNKPGFVVFISAKDESVAGMRDSTKAILREYGSNASWETADMYQRAYAAVLRDGRLTELTDSEAGADRLVLKGTFDKKRHSYEIISAGHEDRDKPLSSIMIDGQQHSLNKRGLNIVVYDEIFREVISSVSFDTHSDSAITRQ